MSSYLGIWNQNFPKGLPKFSERIAKIRNHNMLMAVMTRNTPAYALLIKKYIYGNINLTIMFVLISNFKQILVKLCLKLTWHTRSRSRSAITSEMALSYSLTTFIISRLPWSKVLTSCFINKILGPVMFSFSFGLLLLGLYL